MQKLGTGLVLLFSTLATLWTTAPLGAAQGNLQTFYLAPEQQLSLSSTEKVREPLGSGTDVCVVACVRTAKNTAYHEYQLTESALVAPMSARLWIEVTNHAAAVPLEIDSECPITVFFDVWREDEWKGGWYYCTSLTGLATAIGPGIYAVELSYREDLTPIAASPGDWITVSIWSGVLSTQVWLAPSLFLVGEAGQPSYMVLAGTQEPISGPVQPGAIASPTSSNNGTATSPPASSTSPPPPPPPPTASATTPSNSSTTPTPALGVPEVNARAAPSFEIASAVLAMVIAGRRRTR
jgi:hypothetical protein